ncbi:MULTISPECIES: GNAT family N-acetyltransferase [unclassified Pseudoalteromonas]|jgi:RimJ/RimL family protein N-acetyltransferase|uniref:GNAT family N-acetyltransferase n=1 Tax=unclassified Pseudoalteromonas TaxID=194690 RepID=UPI0023582230|nr:MULTISPECIES: GNAT family N-acetyltransferase [unclassified Pseudoalteromonas]MDC9503713.1 GNAT family N-acetyltransferase [Pseudoalteromonas sp. Angola-18]MDC9531166.1 GNAT family N-acetyltransferase [Pseudoalteromonas sp. Angola-7]
MITLRDFKPKDAPHIINTLNDEQVTRFLSSKIPFPYTQADADWWINQGPKSGIVKAIVVDEQFAGCIGITPGEFEYSRSGEIGYWLNSHFWGQGVMTHAISHICDDAFKSSNLNRIFGAVFAGNTGSIKALTKCGFKAEAVLKQAIYKHGVFYDSHIFSKLK